MNLLIDQYGLRILPRKKPVISLDDLYLLLYTHWALDDASYTDEGQRVQVATGILAAVFFDCRPCSLFDTRVKFDNANDSDEPIDTIDVVDGMNKRKGSGTVNVGRGHRKKCRRDDTVTLVDSGYDVKDDGDFSMTNGESSDNDSDSDSGSVGVCDEDFNTDDDCDAGSEKMRAFLYRHFPIIIVANETPGRPNLVFIKTTLLHTKGEDHNARM